MADLAHIEQIKAKKIQLSVISLMILSTSANSSYCIYCLQTHNSAVEMTKDSLQRDRYDHGP